MVIPDENGIGDCRTIGGRFKLPTEKYGDEAGQAKAREILKNIEVIQWMPWPECKDKLEDKKEYLVQVPVDADRKQMWFTTVTYDLEQQVFWDKEKRFADINVIAVAKMLRGMSE